MKKIISLSAVLFLMMITYTDSQAQIKVGGGLLYGFDIERAGLRLDGLYQFNENFRGAVDFGYYFPETIGDAEYKWWEFNANVHYLFVDNEEWTFYALAGINYLSYDFSYNIPTLPPGGSSDFFMSAAKGADIIQETAPQRTENSQIFTSSSFSGSFSGSESGLNLGAGAEYKVNFGTIFGELKLAGIAGDADQLVFGAGVRINL
jgi:opacity protein-like surface antigen